MSLFGNALANLARAFDFLAEHDPEAAISAASAMREGVDLLESHPLIRRGVAGDLRELVDSYGRTGYVALYRFPPAQDQVRIWEFAISESWIFLPSSRMSRSE